jgi:16S rRNA (uracil1498-N3)-methyltransferase
MMPRVFWENSVQVGDSLVVDGEAGHHFVRVLRSRLGEPLILAASNGPFYAEIQEIDATRPSITVQLVRAHPGHETANKVVLLQGLAKGDKMDTIIQKNVELGVCEIVVFAAARSVVQLGAKQVAKMERWQKIAEQAAAQSQRDVIPRVRYASSVKELLTLSEHRSVIHWLILDEAEEALGLRTALKHIQTQTTQPQTVGIMVGPEGGWDDEERKQLQVQLGAKSITLGPRILRTETAGLVAASAIFYQYGELGG